MKTKSESLFEDLCSTQKIGYEKFKEGASKTPDYYVQIDDIRFIAEVKQVDPNNEQNKLLAEFENNRYIIVSTTPGDKVRSKIKRSVTQISKLAKGKMPGMLARISHR